VSERPTPEPGSEGHHAAERLEEFLHERFPDGLLREESPRAPEPPPEQLPPEPEAALAALVGYLRTEVVRINGE
jgi:hypothetical protein